MKSEKKKKEPSEKNVKGCYVFHSAFLKLQKSIQAGGLESKCHVCKTKEENITRFIGHRNKFKSI